LIDLTYQMKTSSESLLELEAIATEE